jgi:tRNA threonylcarbamoyladenosine biosynthesis protein TsaE
MHRVVLTDSEAQTQAQGAALAAELFARRPAFVQLKGDLGAGKTAFARGFIREWSRLAGDAVPEHVTSPTFNIVKVYGAAAPLAHLDLYRLKSMSELEQIGFEHYFFEHAACLVEWLEQIPEAHASRPAQTVTVTIDFVAGHNASARKLTIEQG